MAIKKITKSKLSKRDAKLCQEVLADLDIRELRGEIVGVKALEKNAGPIDKIKWDICLEIIIFKNLMGFSSKKIAELMRVDKARTSEILHYKVEKFSLDRLLECFLSLNGHNKAFDQRIDEVLYVFHKRAIAV